MDYSNEDEEYDNYLPKRTASIYKEIESFESYELTNCIVYEMAIRTEEVKNILDKLEYIENLKKRHPYLKILTAKAYIPFHNEEDNIHGEATKEEQDFYFTLSKDSLKDFKYKLQKLINFKKSKIFDPNYYEKIDKSKEDDIFYLRDNIEKFMYGNDEIDFEDDTKLCGGLLSILVKFLENDLVENYLIYPKGYVSNFEGADEDYTNEVETEELKNIGTTFNNGINESINKGFHVIQEINKNDRTKPINNIFPNFKRKIHNPNQILTLLNFALPTNEIIDYITHIKNTLSTNSNETIIKSPMELLGNTIIHAEKADKYPKIPTALKFAHMFFIYDYITMRLKYIEQENEKLKQEDQENYDKNKIDTKIVTIFKEVALKLDSYKISDATVSNYYYTIKPYIEELKYPELLTEVSVKSYDKLNKLLY